LHARPTPFLSSYPLPTAEISPPSLHDALPIFGFTFFPSVIWYAYSIMYSLPDFPLLFNWPLALGAVAAATLCTGAATVNACHSTLHEKPAALMVARAPQAGKRIFLEYIQIGRA